MNQDARWLTRYNEVRAFFESVSPPKSIMAGYSLAILLLQLLFKRMLILTGRFMDGSVIVAVDLQLDKTPLLF